MQFSELFQVSSEVLIWNDNGRQNSMLNTEFICKISSNDRKKNNDFIYKLKQTSLIFQIPRNLPFIDKVGNQFWIVCNWVTNWRWLDAHQKPIYKLSYVYTLMSNGIIYVNSFVSLFRLESLQLPLDWTVKDDLMKVRHLHRSLLNFSQNDTNTENVDNEPIYRWQLGQNGTLHSISYPKLTRLFPVLPNF